jgi:hypothetical protein
MRKQSGVRPREKQSPAECLTGTLIYTIQCLSPALTDTHTTTSTSILPKTLGFALPGSFAVLGFELRDYTLNHSTSPFL